MKNIVFGLILVLFMSVSGSAQKQKMSSDPEQPLPPTKQKNKKAAPANALTLESGTSIEAQLGQTLDVKNASVGDEVVLTTTRAIKQNGRTVVEKGARLVGRVTEVQQRTKNNAQSRLGVIIDRIEGKNLSAPVSAQIVSITQAGVGAGVGDTLGTDLSGSSNTSGGATRSSSGGGLLGGVTNTVGGALGTTTDTLGNVTNTAGRTVSGTTAGVGQTLNGIRLSQSSSASAGGSTTLSSDNKNLRLEKGVTFQLRLSESVEN